MKSKIPQLYVDARNVVKHALHLLIVNSTYLHLTFMCFKRKTMEDTKCLVYRTLSKLKNTLTINTMVVEMRKIYFWLKPSTGGSYNLEF